MVNLIFGCLQVFTIFALAVTTVAHAEILSDASQDAAESVIVKSLCDDLTAEGAKNLSNMRLASDEGLACSGKILATLSASALLSDTYILTVSRHLWNLVEHAEAVPSARQNIRKLLEAIRLDVLHPLRSEAWLGLTVLDRADQRLSIVLGKLPYVYAPSPHVANLLPLTSESFKRKIETTHPRFVQELAWLAAQLRRERISTSILSGTLLSLVLELSDSIESYEETNYNFLAEYLDTLFQDKIISVTAPDPVAPGTDTLPSMQFFLTGSVCAAAGNCTALNMTATNLTSVTFNESWDFNRDPSWSSVFIPYLQSTTQPGTLINYAAVIQSIIRGGYWANSFAGVVTKTGNGTSNVNYLLKGVAVVPQCSDTTQCSIIVDLWSSISPPNAPKGTSVALAVEGPMGRRNLPANNAFTQIDRSLGEHKIEVTLGRSASHKGGCCYEWISQNFSIALTAPGVLSPPPIVVSGPNQVGKSLIAAWVDQNLVQDLLPFRSVGMQLRQRINSHVPGQNVIFSDYLGKPSSAYERRYGALWSRLVFSRLAFDWAASELSPIEKNDLATLNKSISRLAHEHLTGALRAELEAYGYVQESLDPTPLLLVMAALVKNTDLVDSLNAAEAQIVARIADSKSSSVNEQLQQAKAAIRFIRSGSPRVDALIRLAETEYAMSLRTKQARRKYERLARELAQLWAQQ